MCKSERFDVGIQTSLAEIVDFGGHTTLNTKVDIDIQTDTSEKCDKAGKIVSLGDKIVITELDYLKSETCVVLVQNDTIQINIISSDDSLLSLKTIISFDKEHSPISALRKRD